jgi:hypothetical protein
MKRTLLGVAFAIVLGTVAIGAEPRTDALATINLNYPSYAAPTTSTTAAVWPRLGDYVTFNATYPKNLEHYGVRIEVRCYNQNGTLVYGEAGPWNQPFLLGGAMSTWFLTNGDAHCVADLYYWSYQGSQKWNFLAETQFQAYAK